MSLKLPRMSKKLYDYKYSVAVSNKNEVYLSVIFQKVSKYDTMTDCLYFFVINADAEWKEPHNTVRSIINQMEEGLGKRAIKIREDKERVYIHIDSCMKRNKYSGYSIRTIR